MFWKILYNKNLRPFKRLQRLWEYYILFARVSKSFKSRHDKIKETGIANNIMLRNDQVAEYNYYWRNFRPLELETLQLSFSLSGKYDKRIVPERVFAIDIERNLISRRDVFFLANKSFYNKWFGKEFFPADYLHKIDGEFFDCDFNGLNSTSVPLVLKSLQYPIVLKPNIDTSGGKNIFFPSSSQEALEILSLHENVVLQEKIHQHHFLNNFYSDSLNTVRVVLYKSVSDNKWYIINTALRMGKDGSLDNVKAGGIVCNISNEGEMNDYAVDWFGRKYYEHPNSGTKFTGFLPFIDDLHNVSLKVANSLHYTRLVGLDAILTENSQWKVIEVNLKYQSIRFKQYAGEAFFGNFTDEVLEYCRKKHWALT